MPTLLDFCFIFELESKEIFRLHYSSNSFHILYEEITDRMIKALEADIIPWRESWMAAGRAISHTTGKPYSLLNQMLLGSPANI